MDRQIKPIALPLANAISRLPFATTVEPPIKDTPY